MAHITARLCRLLRDEVTEHLALKSEALTALAEDWRRLLFPEATDERFADGYAQTVTFGLLMARAKEITLATSLQQVASELNQTSSLIGAALRLLTAVCLGPTISWEELHIAGALETPTTSKRAVQESVGPSLFD